MKQIISTLNIILKQSWITFISIVFLSIVLTAMIYFIPTHAAPEKILRFSTYSCYIISIFFGFYISGGVIRLKLSYLWITNPRYRKNLIVSLIVAAFIVSLLQLSSLLHSGWQWHIALLLPVCITVLSAQLLVAKNFILKLLFVASPLIVAIQIFSYQIGHNKMLLVLGLISIIAIYSMLSDSKPLSKNIKPYLLVINPKNWRRNNPLINWLNIKSVNLLNKFIFTSQLKNIAVALFHPSTRLGTPLLSIMVVASIFFSFHNKPILQIIICAMYIVIFSGALLMEIQALSKQTKPFLHIFAQNNHFIFKKKVLTMIDKQTIYMASIFIVFILILEYFLGFPFDPLLLLRVSITITLLFLTLQPLLLCLDLNSVKIELKLLFTFGVYGSLVFLLSRWHFNHSVTDMMSWQPIIVIILFIVIRQIASQLWLRRPIESFM